MYGVNRSYSSVALPVVIIESWVLNFRRSWWNWKTRTGTKVLRIIKAESNLWARKSIPALYPYSPKTKNTEEENGPKSGGTRNVSLIHSLSMAMQVRDGRYFRIQSREICQWTLSVACSRYDNQLLMEYTKLILRPHCWGTGVRRSYQRSRSWPYDQDGPVLVPVMKDLFYIQDEQRKMENEEESWTTNYHWENKEAAAWSNITGKKQDSHTVWSQPPSVRWHHHCSDDA